MSYKAIWRRTVDARKRRMLAFTGVDEFFTCTYMELCELGARLGFPIADVLKNAPRKLRLHGTTLVREAYREALAIAIGNRIRKMLLERESHVVISIGAAPGASLAPWPHAEKEWIAKVAIAMGINAVITISTKPDGRIALPADDEVATQLAMDCDLKIKTWLDIRRGQAWPPSSTAGV